MPNRVAVKGRGQSDATCNVGCVQIDGKKRLMLGCNVPEAEAEKWTADYARRYPKLEFVMVRDAPPVHPMHDTFV